MQVLNSFTNLRIWVSLRSGQCEPIQNVLKIANAIRDMENFPVWGSDFSDFLNELPDDLHKLID